MITFYLHFFLVLDIDECATNTDNCHFNASCNNNNGSYDCTCNPGFTGNGQTCTGEYQTFPSPTKIYVYVAVNYNDTGWVLSPSLGRSVPSRLLKDEPVYDKTFSLLVYEINRPASI